MYEHLNEYTTVIFGGQGGVNYAPSIQLDGVHMNARQYAASQANETDFINAYIAGNTVDTGVVNTNLQFQGDNGNTHNVWTKESNGSGYRMGGIFSTQEGIETRDLIHLRTHHEDLDGNSIDVDFNTISQLLFNYVQKRAGGVLMSETAYSSDYPEIEFQGDAIVVIGVAQEEGYENGENFKKFYFLSPSNNHVPLASDFPSLLTDSNGDENRARFNLGIGESVMEANNSALEYFVAPAIP
jgi:hypothetical protein